MSTSTSRMTVEEFLALPEAPDEAWCGYRAPIQLPVSGRRFDDTPPTEKAKQQNGGDGWQHFNRHEHPLRPDGMT